MNNKKITTRGINVIIPMTVGSLFLLTLPLFIGQFYMNVLIIVFLNVILATSYRLLYVTGLVSFCHISFFAIGAYTSAALATNLGLPFGVCFLAAGVMPAIIAAAFAWPAVRARGAYFFIITFALFLVIFVVTKHWESVTQGVRGIHGIPPVMGFTTVMPYYYIALVVTAFTIFAMYRLDRSRFGRELLAIGDSDDLAEVIGINVVRHRITSFAKGEILAGFAGSINSHYIRFICPESFPMWNTLYILIWCFLGGARKVWGPVAGAVLLTLIAELLRLTGVLQALFYAAALLTVVMTMPHGIVGLVDTLRTRFGRAEYLGGDTGLGMGTPNSKVMK